MEGEAPVVSEVPCAPGGRLHVSWGLGNELYCVDLVSPSSTEESTASCVQWGRLTPGQRRIAYDSLGQYVELQQCEADPRSPGGWAAAAEYWRTVGAVLSPDPGRAVDADGDDAAALQERAMWDLLALFFLEAQQAQQGLNAAQDLARWLRANAAAVAGGCRAGAHPLPPALVAELREAALPEAHPGYWTCLQRLVCLGWVGEAIDLLGLHSAWLRWEGDLGSASEADPATAVQVSALEAATLLLRRMPAMDSASSAAAAAGGGGARAGSVGAGREFSSLPEFMAYRRGWQAEALGVLRDGELWQRCAAVAPETAEGLRAALSVLAGDESAIQAAVKGWVEHFVALLLHVYPAIKPQAELKQLVQRCYSAAGEGAADDFSHLLALLLEACCDADAQMVMQACSAYPCSDWFMVHGPLLMAAHPAGASVLGRELPHLGGDQLEFYTLDYAAALMPQMSTWQVAVAYLAWCPVHGQAGLESLLGRLPLEAADPSVAGKALSVCRRHSLDRLSEDIQARQGVLSWQAGMLGAALGWLSRAADTRRINVVLRPLADALSPPSAAGGSTGPAGQQQQQQGDEGEEERVLRALQPALDSVPSGSANLALLRVHRLLHSARGSAAEPAEALGGGSGGERGPGAARETPSGAAAAAAVATAAAATAAAAASGESGRLGEVVRELRRLPAALRDACVPLVCASLAVLAPGELGESDALQLLAWLQGAEARLLPPPAAVEAGGAGASPQQLRQLRQLVSLARLALCRSLAASQMEACMAT